MREITIVYDDGRPDCRVALDAAVSGDPFAWDGANRERLMEAAEGFPAPQSARIAARQLIRADRALEDGLRLDVTWFDAALTAYTGRMESHVPGVEIHIAAEQAGRTLLLVNPEDVRHVVQVEADGKVVLQRRFGYLCDVSRLRAAASRYGCARTEGFRAVLAAGGRRAAERDDSLAAVCETHELIRREHPEWYDAELSALLKRPVWDEALICAEHGYGEGAWWRSAARAAADGEFYSPAGRAVEDALVWRPAVCWYRATATEEPAVAEAARWLGLPDRDVAGNSALSVVKDAWRDGVPIPDEDGVLARVLAAFGVGLVSGGDRDGDRDPEGNEGR